MIRIVLHIGLEKTGTTSLQRFLTLNRTRLLARYGILYPTQPALFHGSSHVVLTAALLAPAPCDFVPIHLHPELKQAEAALAQASREGPRVIVLSSEHLSSRLGSEAITRLRRLLSDFRVDIVIYLRRQDEMAISAFSTDLLCGRRTWLQPRDISPGDRYFDYARLLEPWASAFGSDSIRIRIFDRAQLRGQNVIHDFLADLDIEDSRDFEWEPPLNRALNLAEAQLVRLLNQRLTTWDEAISLGRPQDYHEADRLRGEVLERARAIPAIREAASLSGILSSQDRRELLARFSTINSSIARTYLGRDRLFDIPPMEGSDRPAPATGTGPLQEAALAEILLAMARHIQELEQQPLRKRILDRVTARLGRSGIFSTTPQH